MSTVIAIPATAPTTPTPRLLRCYALEAWHEFLRLLRGAASEHLAHGVQLRQDATAPFTRLVESQSEVLAALRDDLLAQQHALMRIQGGLAVLEHSGQAAASTRTEDHR